MSVPDWLSPRRWLATIVVGLCVLALPLATIPTVAAAVIRCCCGEHDASHACACRDCPANHDRSPAPRDATIKACGGASIEVTLASFHAVAPAIVAPVRDLAIAAPARRDVAPRRRLLDPPPSPPPRR